MFLLFIVIYPDLSWFFHACLNFTSNMTDQLVVGKLCVESNRQHDPALKEYDMKHANVAQLWMYIYLALGHRSSFTSHNTQKAFWQTPFKYYRLPTWNATLKKNTTDYQHKMPLLSKTFAVLFVLFLFWIHSPLWNKQHFRHAPWKNRRWRTGTKQFPTWDSQVSEVRGKNGTGPRKVAVISKDREKTNNLQHIYIY